MNEKNEGLLMKVIFDSISEIAIFALETGMILLVCVLMLSVMLGLPFLGIAFVTKLFCMATGVQFSWLYPSFIIALAFCYIVTAKK
jgi:hypothetical protein